MRRSTRRTHLMNVIWDDKFKGSEGGAGDDNKKQ